MDEKERLKIISEALNTVTRKTPLWLRIIGFSSSFMLSILICGVFIGLVARVVRVVMEL